MATTYVQRGAPGDRRLAVDPDVRVELTSADYFAKRDPVLAGRSEACEAGGRTGGAARRVRRRSLGGASSAPGHACVSAKRAPVPRRGRDEARRPPLRRERSRARGQTVVLAHQSNGDLCEWAPYARRLAARGFFAFPFDLRGHGSSEGRPTYGRLGLDVAAAVRAIRRSERARSSSSARRSAGSRASSAPRAPAPVAGLVAVSAPAEIAGRLNASLRRSRCASRRSMSRRAGPERALRLRGRRRRLFEATGTTEKRVEVVPGSLHGVALVAGSARVRTLLESFLRDPAGTVR